MTKKELEMNLTNEIISEKNKFQIYKKRKKTLDLKSLPDFEILRDEYDYVTKMLDKEYPKCRLKTLSEDKFWEKLQKVTKLRFYRSIWIGNRNIDLFCPAIGRLYPPILKGEKVSKPKDCHQGLAIEVDGPIHDHHLKVKKDFSKFNFLEKLGIRVWSVRNEDLKKKAVKDHIQALRQYPRIDSRARKRLWKRIFVETILFNASDYLISKTFKKRG